MIYEVQILKQHRKKPVRVECKRRTAKNGFLTDIWHEWGSWIEQGGDSRSCLGYGRDCITGRIAAGETGGSLPASARVPGDLRARVLALCDHVYSAAPERDRLALRLRYVARLHGPAARDAWREATGCAEITWYKVHERAREALAAALAAERGRCAYASAADATDEIAQLLAQG